MVAWLLQIFNVILNLESIPPYLKTATIVPIYKGKRKNPLDTNSYRGISLSSLILKVFETIVLRRLLPVLEEMNIPHLNQTAYQRSISIQDVILLLSKRQYKSM